MYFIDVGNKAAVYPMQLLGFDVDVVNSVHFSNHTGFEKGFEGDVLQGDQLRKIMEGLERNGLLSNIGHLLTGYIGSESFLEAVLDVLKTTRHAGGKLRYVCDPVLGDNGKFYVPKELVKLYQEKVIPEADAVTPNQFEAEQLTGLPLKTVNDVKKVCKSLHAMGPNLVLLTSVDFQDENDGDDKISVFASKRISKDGTPKVWRIDCPKVPGAYTGTGDLFAALLLAHSAINPTDLPATLEKVVNTMHATIKRSLELSPEIPVDSKYTRGLKLIQCKDIIENPPREIKAQLI